MLFAISLKILKVKQSFLASIEFQTVSCRLLLRMARMDMDRNNFSTAN